MAEATGEDAPAGVAAPVGTALARARRTASHVEGMDVDDGRALLAELLDAVHRARSGLPPRVGGR